MTPALSPSRAADFKQCPLLFRFRTIDRLEGPPSPAAARGTLVHAVLEHLFDLPAAERTPAAAVALLEPRWTALVEERPELRAMIDDDEALTEESWFAGARTLVEQWFDLEDPTRLEPAARELYVETEVEGLTLRGTSTASTSRRTGRCGSSTTRRAGRRARRSRPRRCSR